jgi:TonB-linked SusC/RagA family outer membrane protein
MKEAVPGPLFKKRVILMMALMFMCLVLRAQDRIISGSVTDQSDGSPLIGVSVLVKGTTTGTITDVNGSFSVAVPEGNSTLVFSYVGYNVQEVDASNLSVVNVKLQASTTALEEVVVTGYSVQRKKDLLGSVAIVDVSSLKAQPAGSVTEALQGKAAGVNIVNDGSPGSTPQIRIRGYSTINNNDPLYIVDGVPYQGKTAFLNQNDIESVQVLKDASAASIYGSRANNGVIIITTKQGKEGSAQITFDAFYGISAPIQSTFPEFMTPMQYAQYRWQAYRNAELDPGASLGAMYGTGEEPILPEYLIAGSATGPNVTPADADPAKYSYDPLNFYQITRANHEGTNWMDAITQTAPIQSYQLGASGGGKAATYALSFGYLDQEGTIKHTSFKRYNVRSNVQFRAFDDRLRIGENLLFTRSEGVGFATNTSNPGDYQQAYSPVGNVYKMQTIVPVYDIAGNFAGARGPTLGDAKNPLAILYRARENFNKENRIFGNLYAELDIIKGLTARTSFGVDLSNFHSQNIRYPAMEDAVAISTNGYGAIQGFGTQWTWSNTLNYKVKLKELHDVSVLAGTEAIAHSSRVLTGSRDNFFILGDQNYYYLNTGTGNITNAESGSKSALASLFARVDYSFNDKYLFSATVRRDGSSNFGADNRYATFPSFSGAWRISAESFMQNVTWLSDLKLRVGYGETGNQNIPGNNAYDLYETLIIPNSYPLNPGGGLVSGASQIQIGNQLLRWEKLQSINVGLDFTFLNGVLDGSLDVYNRKTSGMLFPVPLPQQTAGMANSPFQNVGSMKNQGVELVLNYHYGGTSDGPLRFDISANIATNDNEILSLAPGIESSPYGTSGLTTTIFKVGYPYGEFYGYRQAGIFQNEQEVAASTQPGARAGGMKYADANNDGVFSPDDRTTLGSPLPDFTYGLNINAYYGNFDVQLFFYGSEGNKLYNVTKLYTDFQSFPSAASTRLLNAWSPSNPNSNIPSPSALASTLEYQSSSYYVEDGSYFRLKNLQIGYSINADKLPFSRLRIYGSVTNVFTITRYSGLDPEVTQVNSTFNLPGLDLGIYPNPRQFLFGINAAF